MNSLARLQAALLILLQIDALCLTLCILVLIDMSFAKSVERQIERLLVWFASRFL